MSVAGCYLDASVLVSLSITERTTEAAQRLIGAETELAVSSLTLLEAEVALSRRRKQGVITAEIEARVCDHLQRAAERGERLVLHALNAVDYRVAAALARRIAVPVRSLDALHIAVTQRLGLALVTLDRRLCDAAAQAGVPTRWEAVTGAL